MLQTVKPIITAELEGQLSVDAVVEKEDCVQVQLKRSVYIALYSSLMGYAGS